MYEVSPHIPLECQTFFDLRNYKTITIHFTVLQVLLISMRLYLRTYTKNPGKIIQTHDTFTRSLQGLLPEGTSTSSWSSLEAGEGGGEGARGGCAGAGSMHASRGARVTGCRRSQPRTRPRAPPPRRFIRAPRHA